MKKLIIDTTDRKTIIIGLEIDSKKDLLSQEQERRAQAIIPLIQRIMRKNKIKFSELTEIEVNPGPGSYTGIRVGISIANALSKVLQIPINGKKLGLLVEPKY